MGFSKLKYCVITPLRSLAFVLLSASLYLSLVGCQDNENSDRQAVFSRKSGQIYATLSSDQKVWHKGTPLYLLFTVINGTNRAVPINGRMAWPDEVTLYVQSPGSDKTNALSVAVTLAVPSQSDIIDLQPGRAYGTVIEVDPDRNQLLVKELRKPVAGQYTFWVVYSSPKSKKPYSKELTLSSNKVVVNVP